MSGTWLGTPIWVWIVVGVVIVAWNVRFIIKNKRGD